MLATPGEVIADRFEIDRHVGAGGMGVVYRVRDRQTEGAAALKLVRHGDPQIAARFSREARLLAELVHPNIVSYIAHGDATADTLYLAMEWLEGEDLATRMQVARLTVDETLELARRIATALAVAHRRGVVHRDIKPSNLFLVDLRVECAKLLDFGVARSVEAETLSLTRTGSMIGTPLYMAPEQVTGAAVDPRTDVFALGAVLFHCLTERAPFRASTLPELVARLTSRDEAPRIRTLAPHVPEPLDALVARMLAKDPAQRPRDADAVLAALDGRAVEIASRSPLPQIETADTGIVEAPGPGADFATLVERGRQAQVAGRWADGRAAFESALALHDAPEAHAGLGDVLWWLGEVRASIQHLEQAYLMFSKVPDPEAVGAAAMCAIGIAMTYKKTLDNDAAARGWMARAARLLGDEPGPLHGVLWVTQGMLLPDPIHAVKLQERALAHARAVRDRDLEMIAMSALGGSLVSAGQVERGLALIDEAMAGTLAGEFERLDTVVTATCCMVIACDQVADTERMLQWTRVADQFMSKYGAPLLFAECRAHYGSALLAAGQWDDAERELVAAKTSAPVETQYFARSVARLADLRVRQGRLDDAHQLLSEISDRPQGRSVAAALHHAAGEHAVAAALLRRSIGAAGSQILDIVGALDLLVDTSLATNDLDSAAVAVSRLEHLARTHGAQRVAAHAAFAAGRHALASDDLATACDALERATDLFAAASSPHEAARARLALANVLARQRSPLATTEARTAKAAFERLGARRDLASADELLQTLG